MCPDPAAIGHQGFDAPAIGSVWRERRRDYRKRTVKVLTITDTPNPYVVIETILGTNGYPPRRTTRSSVRGRLWHRAFEEVTSCEDLCLTECQGVCGVG